MASISKYVIQDRGGNDLTTYVYDVTEYREARDEAMRLKGRVMELEYEFSDSSMIDDFTEDDDVSHGRCEVCDQPITADEDARLLLDRDFVEHGDGHLIRRVTL